MDAAIHILDDDPDIRSSLGNYLANAGYQVDGSANAAELRDALKHSKPNLIILDLGLPDGDGMTLAKEIHRNWGIPLIIVTGRMGEIDRVVGLEVGADDYVTKPFNPRELLARIRAVLRRAELAKSEADTMGEAHTDVSTSPPGESRSGTKVRFNNWELDLVEERLNAPDGSLIRLNSSEFDLLRIFVAHPQQVLTRGEILQIGRSKSGELSERSVDIRLHRLRQKLSEWPSGVDIIKTRRGEGYIFTPRTTYLSA